MPPSAFASVAENSAVPAGGVVSQPQLLPVRDALKGSRHLRCVGEMSSADIPLCQGRNLEEQLSEVSLSSPRSTGAADPTLPLPDASSVSSMTFTKKNHSLSSLLSLSFQFSQLPNLLPSARVHYYACSVSLSNIIRSPHT